MKMRRFATALESDIVLERSDQAPGFVSSMMVRSDGLCSNMCKVDHSSPRDLTDLKKLVRSALMRLHHSLRATVDKQCLPVAANSVLSILDSAVKLLTHPLAERLSDVHMQMNWWCTVSEYEDAKFSFLR